MSDLISRSTSATRVSWKILWQNKKLILFPAVSIVLTLYILTVLVSSQLWKTLIGAPHILMLMVTPPFIDLTTGPFFFSAFLLVLLCCCVIGFFTAALVGAFSPMLTGNAPSMVSGIRKAVRRLPAIVVWSVAWGIAGFLSYAGDLILRSIFHTSLAFLGYWRVAIDYMLPVILIEDRGILSAWEQAQMCNLRMKPDYQYGRYTVFGPGFADAGFFLLFWAVVMSVLLFPLLLAGMAVIYVAGFEWSHLFSLILTAVGFLILVLAAIYLVITAALNGTLAATRYWFFKTGARSPLYPEELIAGQFHDGLTG